MQNICTRFSLLNTSDAIVRKSLPQGLKQVDLRSVAKFICGFPLQAALHILNRFLIRLTLTTENRLLFQKLAIAVLFKYPPLFKDLFLTSALCFFLGLLDPACRLFLRLLLYSRFLGF